MFHHGGKQTAASNYTVCTETATKDANSSHHWHSFGKISLIKEGSHVRCILSGCFQVLFVLMCTGLSKAINYNRYYSG